jgi:hypothetical protein
VCQWYSGAVSNKCIVKDIGFLNLMQYADIVMAECDFEIRDEVEMRGDYLSHPPFRNGKFQLPSESTRSTAEVRIHIEPLCHQMVADDVFQSCAYLTNVQTPIIKCV